MSPEHNHNAALRLYGPPGMFTNDLQLHPAPHNAIRETNQETLHRLSHNVMKIDIGELTALDAYHLYLRTDENGSTWGFCLEAARITEANNIMVLFQNDKEEEKEKSYAGFLCPHYELKTRLACRIRLSTQGQQKR